MTTLPTLSATRARLIDAALRAADPALAVARAVRWSAPPPSPSPSSSPASSATAAAATVSASLRLPCGDEGGGALEVASEDLVVLAAGKAAGRMAEGLFSGAPAPAALLRVRGGLVVTARGAFLPPPPQRAEAPEPVPEPAPLALAPPLQVREVDARGVPARKAAAKRGHGARRVIGKVAVEGAGDGADGPRGAGTAALGADAHGPHWFATAPNPAAPAVPPAPAPPPLALDLHELQAAHALRCQQAMAEILRDADKPGVGGVGSAGGGDDSASSDADYAHSESADGASVEGRGG